MVDRARTERDGPSRVFRGFLIGLYTRGMTPRLRGQVRVYAEPSEEHRLSEALDLLEARCPRIYRRLLSGVDVLATTAFAGSSFGSWLRAGYVRVGPDKPPSAIAVSLGRIAGEISWRARGKGERRARDLWTFAAERHVAEHVYGDRSPTRSPLLRAYYDGMMDGRPQSRINVLRDFWAAVRSKD